MPDLSNKETHRYWSKYPDPLVYRVILFIESVENWTLDGDEEIERSMTKFARMLDNIGEIDFQDEASLIGVSISLKFGRAMRLIQSLDGVYPGAAAKIFRSAELEDSTIKKLFLRRNLVFERLRLLSRIFSDERLDKMSETLEKHNG